MPTPIHESAELAKETLILLKDAYQYFPVAVSRTWLEKMIRKGTRGITLETFFFCNRRYTSKEAIQRFIERTQNQENRESLPAGKPLTRSKAELEKARLKFNLPEPE